MYEYRDEAVDSLAPNSVQPVADTDAPESWKFKHLGVTQLANIAHVEFKQGDTFKENTENELREDLAHLADLLTKNSRVLFDFTGVASVSALSINELASFNQNLRTKGSRIAVCCLDADVRESFFDRSNGHKNQI